MVLQVMDARDISSPKRASGSSGRRMLRLDLTDGDATVVAVEYRELTSIEDASAAVGGVASPRGRDGTPTRRNHIAANGF